MKNERETLVVAGVFSSLNKLNLYILVFTNIVYILISPFLLLLLDPGKYKVLPVTKNVLYLKIWEQIRGSITSVFYRRAIFIMRKLEKENVPHVHALYISK